ncbi:MAG: exodeoxyribonuclease VII large subunit [Lewinellaceae bacterium]|nr:exodeoxyribonuclease VII large subunit [Lewinellaceae bacterium]
MIPSMRLSHLQERIHRALVLNFSDPIWIKAEIAQIRVNRGHHYIQLVEHAPGEKERVAQVDAVLWSNRIRQLPDIVKRELPEILKEGHEVQLLVRVDYHPVYGLKLIIEEIDLTTAAGQMARQRQVILDELRRMGLLERNRQLPFPLVIQRIAVITSQQAAGWIDFQRQLEENSFGLAFQLEVFQAAMQGGHVEQEVLAQLEAVNQRSDEFDACVLIRGGGSKLDLAWFDNQSIGTAIASLQIPMLTGIGHEIDKTISDLVAARSLKTPTAVASFILETNLQFDSQLASLAGQMGLLSERRVVTAAGYLDQVQNQVRHHWHRWVDRQDWELTRWHTSLRQFSLQEIRNQAEQLEQRHQQIHNLDPALVLARGFSMTLYRGHPLKDPGKVKPGETIITHLEKGRITSQITNNEQTETDL